MNKIMSGLHVKSRIVSGTSSAATSRSSGVEAPDVFAHILAAARSASAPDIEQLARSWKCDPEQVHAFASVNTTLTLGVSLMTAVLRAPVHRVTFIRRAT